MGQRSGWKISCVADDPFFALNFELLSACAHYSALLPHIVPVFHYYFLCLRVSVSPSPRVVKFGLQLSAPLFHHSIIPSPSPEFWILALATDYFF